MRPRVSWMTGIDESILEFMASLGDPEGEYVYMTPQVVRQNLESRDLVSRSRSTYSRRMGTLAEAGLLEPLEKDSAYYKITPLGVDYVEGNLGASELEELV